MTVARRLKRESTIALGGLITPDESMSSSNGTDIKQEEIEEKFSDILEGSLFKSGPSNLSNHGLRIETETIDLDPDEGYVTQAAERQRRSVSVSFRASQPPNRDEMVPRTSMTPTIPETGLQIVGRKVKFLVDAIEELRQIGLQIIETDLPELVLVGDQSAGKSSLMGAIAEIHLPKSSGVCTKCPANIKTSPAKTWSCKVSLHEHYSYTPIKAPRTQPFPNWVARDGGLQIREFKTISDKDELEELLKWAQIALLNPNSDCKSFVPSPGQQNQVEQTQSLKFSPNVISVEITGPDLPALSFYDLPGMFQAAENPEQQYLVGVFEKLATEYIKRENALVVCAMTMQNDPALSRTKAVISKLHAEKRCVGVLTMPDRLQNESTHNDYENILNGETYVLPRGYFVTKQPGPDSKLPRLDYHALARQEEERFFDTDQIWTGEWSKFRNRCGTASIQEYLSQEFAKQIAKCLPRINEKVIAQTRLVDEQLSRLPDLQNANAQHVVRERLARFSDGVRRLLEGGATSNRFLSSWSELSNDFRDAILDMKPRFIYKDPSDESAPEVISLDDESEDGSLSTRGSPPPDIARRRLDFGALSTQTPHSVQTPKRMRMPDPDTPASRNLTAAQFAMRPSPPARREDDAGSVGSGISSPDQRRSFQKPAKKNVFAPHLGAGKKFMSIAQIRELILLHKRPGLPDHVDDAVKEQVCLLSVTPWNGPLQTLADHTFTSLRRSIGEVLQYALEGYHGADIYKHSKRYIGEFLDSHENNQRSILDNLYNLETYKLFTINNPAFMSYKAEELVILEEPRRKWRAHCYVQKHQKIPGKTLSQEERVKKERAVTADQLGPDPFHNEIQLAAFVRGYYKTAGLRFADVTCQHIQANLFRKVHKDIGYLLERILELDNGNAEQICLRLTAENPEEAKLRSDLLTEQQRLTKASDRLAQLAREYGEDDESDEMDVDHAGDDGTCSLMNGYGKSRGHSPTP